ncbi:MAG TPA: polymerase [Syntrophomonadaceae bacterium]|jgi:O-antigen ligase|nr:polymerase [Syntrophomonadaceae bacterium]
MEATTKALDLPQNHRETRSVELYLVVLYAGLDWLFRQGGLAFMQGIWDELLFIIIIGIWLLRTAVQQWAPRRSGMLLPFCLYISIMLFLVLINSPDDSVALEGMRVMVQYVFWFFIAYHLLRSRQDAKGLVNVFLLLCLAIALVGVMQYIQGVEMPAAWVDKAEQGVKTRVFSIIGSPNVLGSLMILAISVAYAMYYGSKHWLKQLIYAGVLLVCALCLLFTFSRGAWLAIILSALLLGLWVDKRVLIIILLMAVLTPSLMPAVYDRMAYMMSSDYIASSERGGRLGRWEVAMNHWRGSPEFGVGLGQFGGAVAARHYPEDSFYADNWYLKVGTETGWVGLTATLLLLITGLRRARSALDATEDPYLKIMGLGILAGLVGILAHNCVENIFEVPMMASYFWFFLGLVVALPHLQSSPLNDME